MSLQVSLGWGENRFLGIFSLCKVHLWLLPTSQKKKAGGGSGGALLTETLRDVPVTALFTQATRNPEHKAVQRTKCLHPQNLHFYQRARQYINNQKFITTFTSAKSRWREDRKLSRKRWHKPLSMKRPECMANHKPKPWLGWLPIPDAPRLWQENQAGAGIRKLSRGPRMEGTLDFGFSSQMCKVRTINLVGQRTLHGGGRSGHCKMPSSLLAF